ncbi:CGNR zinc finger domain-containing protein [Streptomyces sp. URMC 124]|uniref:CGNR zinc finger domain-containing protein n=1 Tax=Streptomyces sp. URMC 124 TaxID=3423405 RepID=UPI003F1AEE34
MTLAEDLVNTYNIVRNVEKMPDVAALSALLDAHGMRPPTALTEADLAAVRELRPVLREVFGAPDAATAVSLLNAVLARHRAAPHYSDHDGSWHLHVAAPDAPVADQYAVNAAMGLLTVVGASGMERLHVCVGNRCAEVFVDTSRNLSRRFCSPQICGNRATAAAHRARRKAADAAP